MRSNTRISAIVLRFSSVFSRVPVASQTRKSAAAPGLGPLLTTLDLASQTTPRTMDAGADVRSAIVSRRDGAPLWTGVGIEGRRSQSIANCNDLTT
jgi:hypothetical protein